MNQNCRSYYCKLPFAPGVASTVPINHKIVGIYYEATTDELDYLNPDPDDNHSDQSKKFEKRKQRD
jgi:hypothetical protein